MKLKKSSFILLMILILLSACSPTEKAMQKALSQTQNAQPILTNTPEPTATLEPTPTSTATPEPTSTPEPTATNTPEYCNAEDFVTALGEISSIMTDFNDQIQIMVELTGVDWQTVIVEISKLQRELYDVEVPECMTYLKQLLDGAMSDAISAATYIYTGSISEGTTALVETTTGILLFTDELERLVDCFPNCKP